MSRIRLVWSERAKENLQGIRERIAEDAPQRAKKFVKRLRDAAGLLKKFPELGAPVPELEHLDLLEIIREDYRIVYRYSGGTVLVLIVRHGSLPLTERHLAD